MAEAMNGSTFEQNAHEDPYGFMSQEDREYMAENLEIIPLDAAKDDGIPTEMTWAESHIGGDGPLTVTDYGRHREECDTMADFIEFIREKLKDGPGPQYLKVMDDDKEQIADTLVAITKADGYVVIPYFGE